MNLEECKLKKRSLSLLLCVCLILSCTVAALAADDVATISIKVRVFDVISGKAYEVGSDTAAKGSSGIESEPYTLKELSAFTAGTYTRLRQVVGSWYFPVSSRMPGSIVYFSNNASTATITYWVENYMPPKPEQPKPGNPTEPSVPTPDVSEGEVALTVKVIYVDYKDQVVGYGDAKALKLKCQGSYCKHNVNCSILCKDFHPKTLGIGESITQNELTYKWIGWSKYTASTTPQFATFYDWKSDTTNVTTPKGATFYLIYKNSDDPASNETELDKTNMTVNGDDVWTYLDAMYIMDFLAGTIQLSPEAQLAADYDRDGEITYLDAMAIMDNLAGAG